MNSIEGFPIAQPPTELEDEADRKLWLKTLLRDERWIDVAIVFDVPSWADEALSWRLEHVEYPWKPWVIASSELTHLRADLVLSEHDGDGMFAAHERAQKWSRRS
jgi:hypothetical protein